MNRELYWYEMWMRPMDIGSQPKGIKEFDESRGRHGLVAYDRELTEQELNEYEMKKWEE